MSLTEKFGGFASKNLAPISTCLARTGRDWIATVLYGIQTVVRSLQYCSTDGMQRV